jgi:hypothetical protein
MDPISSILAAVIAGSAAALQSTITDIVKDGYAALKKLIGDRYKSIDLEPIERDPTAPDERRKVEQQLRDSGASADADVLSHAKALLDHVARHQPALQAVIGVDLSRIRAGTVRIEDIVSAGAGVRVQDAVAAKDFVVSNVRAGTGEAPPGKR